MGSSQDDRGPELNNVMISFLVLTYLCVSLRCFVRLKITKSFKADDWILIVALAGFTLYAAAFFTSVHYGFGRHNTSLSQHDEIKALKYTAEWGALYIANIATIKLSIAVLLLRISVQRRYSWILKITMMILVTYTVAFFLFDVFQCQPVAKQWDYTLDGYCVAGDRYVLAAYAFSALTVFTDWLYALIPIPMLWSSKMTWRTKLSIAVILSLGIVASIATLIRIKFLIGIKNTKDLLYTSTDAALWTITEPGLAIIAASLATLRPLLRAMNIQGFGISDEHELPTNTCGTSSTEASSQGPQDLEFLTQPTHGMETSGADPEGAIPKTWRSGEEV